ncbi:hypothetical protein RB195_002386 [Necator americanus]|uniref:Reverse transcriptase domain-containing protein n=1 Tax=Necator americanus TaxID=51031 RepID=A0ABR1DKC0_NECAM
MLRRRDRSLLQDSKVIPTDHVAAQHHLLVTDLKISCPRKRHPRTETQRIKWWNPKDRKEVFFAFVASSTLPHPTRSVEEMWSSTSSVIRLTAENTLGKTTPGGNSWEAGSVSFSQSGHHSTLDMEHTKIWLKELIEPFCALWSDPGEVFERVLEARLRKIGSVSLNQSGFVKDCSTIDAIHAVRILLEKHREKNRNVHLAFLDLEKAFDRVPHELLWMCMRSHRVPEEYVRWTKLLYAKPVSVVQCAAGTSRPFPVQVGVHQGSSLSPLLFILCMDTITKEIQKQHPWTLLLADDVMLALESRDYLQEQVQSCKDQLQQY